MFNLPRYLIFLADLRLNKLDVGTLTRKWVLNRSKSTKGVRFRLTPFNF